MSIEFKCNTSENESLSLHPIYDDKLLSIAIEKYDYELKSLLSVHLTIEQSEQLMDEIHKALIKLEGGKND